MKVMKVGFATSSVVFRGARGVRDVARICGRRTIMTATTDVASRTRAAVAENNVMVFSKSRCPFCMEVKSLFDELGVEHAIWELDEVR